MNLVYGIDDPTEDINLLIINDDELTFLIQLSNAKTYRDAFDGSLDYFEDVQKEREEAEEIINLDDPFDLAREGGEESGIVYQALVGCDLGPHYLFFSEGALDDPRVKDNIRVESTPDGERLFIRDDDTAAHLLSILKRRYRNRKLRLTRDDSKIQSLYSLFS